MKIYKTITKSRNLHNIINFLPFISLYYKKNNAYINIGWIIWTIQIEIKS